eukprot:gene23455-28454_t
MEEGKKDVELAELPPQPPVANGQLVVDAPSPDEDVGKGVEAVGAVGGKTSFWSIFDYTKLNGVSGNKDDTFNVPELSYLQLFIRFLWFGARAFGGPVAQISMMKTELVTEEKWISNERFNRVYAVYQALPGPEATELACYFGYVAKGRLGSLVGGLGFLLPGWLLVLLFSWIYVEYGLENDYVQKSFTAIQCALAAIIFRATYKLAEGALNVKEGDKKVFSWERAYLTFLCFLASILHINFFLSLAVSGLINTIFENHFENPLVEKYRHYLGLLGGAMLIGFYILYVSENGWPSESMIGGSNSSVSKTDPNLTSLLELGLIAGCVTFGGAYTTLPFIYSAAVKGGGWLTQREFLDALAITNMLPTPLVTFVTMVGYIGDGIGGAIMMTIGIFLPAFSFTFIGHEFFESIVDNKFVHPFLDGIGAAVIGLLIQVAFQFVQSVVVRPVDAVAFLLAFAAVFHFTDKYTQPCVLLVAAIAGQALYDGIDLSETEA